MGHKSEYLTIAGIKIKIVTGEKTQTVNVYQDETEGDYREVYRISDKGEFVSRAKLEKEAKSQLDRFLILKGLDCFLILKGAVREGPRSKR